MSVCVWIITIGFKTKVKKTVFAFRLQGVGLLPGMQNTKCVPKAAAAGADLKVNTNINSALC